MQTFIQYGIPNIWADHYINMGLSVTTFKAISAKILVGKYKIPADQVSFVKNCLARKPADKDVVQQLLENSNYV